MKKRTVLFSLTSLIVFGGFSAFGQQNEKAEKARKDEATAQNEIRLAKMDSAANFQKFKKESELRISENQKKIIELKTNKLIRGTEANKSYDNKVLVLIRKNEILKKKIEEADDTKTDVWSLFKTGFNHNMEELGEAIKSI